MASHTRAILALSLCASLTLAACSTASEDTTTSSVASNGPLSIYATTGYLADALANLAPEADIITMVGPGGDPHTYQPTTQDIEKLRTADLVFSTGLHLEAQMSRQLDSLGEKHVAVGEQLPTELLLPWPDEADHFDPHIWNSPDAWLMVVDTLATTLAEHDADNAKHYQDNAASYRAEIEEVSQRAHELLDPLPAPRVLITGHDAFNYFGETFDLEVHATDFISTEAAKSAQEISELADLIVDKQVPVIFQDNQANPQAITALREAVNSRGWEVEISSEELFADSLGPTAPTDTYLGVFAHNATVVAQALG